jgi:hypothetical protein
MCNRRHALERYGWRDKEIGINKCDDVQTHGGSVESCTITFVWRLMRGRKLEKPRLNA